MTEAAQPLGDPGLSGTTGWQRMRQLVIRHVLRPDDTPHRIALGVALGFLVGVTPTIGIQMLIYVALATLLGANKVSGILPVWISNPLTAVPLYYGNWWLGRWLLTGETSASATTRAEIAGATEVPEGQSIWNQLFEPEFWWSLIERLSELGIELWVGSLVVGVVTGFAGYWYTRRMVTFYRARRHKSPSVIDSA